MIAWKQPLREFEWLVHQVWYLEVNEGESGSVQPHLIPNPRAHLLFTPPQQRYEYVGDEVVLQGRGSHLLTVSDQMLRLEELLPIRRIGITFRPEGLYVLNAAFAPTLNQSAWFDWLNDWFDEQFQAELWQYDSKSESFKSQLLSTIERHFAQLEVTPPNDKAWRLAHKVVDLIEKGPQLASDINALAAQCACSRRTLERAFKQVVGLSLKQYLQMQRLELMILSLYAQGDKIDWADFSASFGFSDQSHLIRTLKQQLQQTPEKYLHSRNLTIDVYGDFESSDKK